MNIPTTGEFAEIHVISDLHLGGRPGFQIFGSTSELVWLLDDLRQRSPAKKIGLVINGDFVDFLAQAPTLPFDPEGAADKLAQIAGDTSFLPVFDALRRFASTDSRHLIVNLGNHDLELALPWVGEKLLDELSGGDCAARGRITLSLDGTGVLLTVGGARVLCVHGNEVDAWNVADYEEIRRIGRDLIQARPVAPWVPNGGSQLVTDVMNPLKQRFPFIELLKPEGPALFPTLLALDPAVLGQLRKFLAAGTQHLSDTVRMTAGFLDVGSAPVGARRGTGVDAVEADVQFRTRRREHDELARKLLDRVEDRWQHDAVALDLISRDQRGEYIGVFGAIGKLATGKGTVEALRDALDVLDTDRSFDPATEDETYRDLDKLVGADVDFLIAGHTHLERALRRRRGRGCYFNSGTWARLIRIPPQVRQSPVEFGKLFERLKAGTMDALDGAAAEPGVTMRRCSVVSVWQESDLTVGELRRVTAQTGPMAFAAETVPQTRLSVTLKRE
jgi:UDP-2,3-diacylglucosamine pyrophosphatase LpxH